MRVALLALLASGCVLPQPRTVSGETSSLEPIERLGQYVASESGHRFVAVERGSLPPSHTYVLVHGWAPGWGRAVLDDPRLRAWQAVDRNDRPFEPWMHEMAGAIHAADPHAIVLVYSWLDDAATSRFILAQRNAFARTDMHGRALAAALSEALGPDFVEGSGRVHLIGHSYGARVATLAALSLPKAPRQLTLLDVPDAPMTRITGSHSNLSELLQELPTGRAAGQTFVDNYFSMVGQRYGDTVSGIIDVALTPPYHAFDYRSRHLYGTWFYAESAHHEFGLGWSPLIGQPPAAGCYEQPFGEVELARGCGDLR